MQNPPVGRAPGSYPQPPMQQGWAQPPRNNMGKPMGPPMGPDMNNMGMNLFNSAMIAAAHAMLQGQAPGAWGHMAPPPQGAPPPGAQGHQPASGEGGQQGNQVQYGAQPTSTAWGWGQQTEHQPGSYATWAGSGRQQGWS